MRDEINKRARAVKDQHSKNQKRGVKTKSVLGKSWHRGRNYWPSYKHLTRDRSFEPMTWLVDP